MKKLFCLSITFFIALCSFGAKIQFTVHTNQTEATKSTALNHVPDTSGQPSSVVSVKYATLKDLSKALGRKPTLKEKVGWFFLKKRLQHSEPDAVAAGRANSNAVLGFVFSILGVLIFPLFSIPALILSMHALKAEKRNPGVLTNGNKGLAKAGEIISIVDIAAFILGIIVLIVYFSNLHPL